MGLRIRLPQSDYIKLATLANRERDLHHKCSAIAPVPVLGGGGVSRMLASRQRFVLVCVAEAGGGHWRRSEAHPQVWGRSPRFAPSWTRTAHSPKTSWAGHGRSPRGQVRRCAHGSAPTRAHGVRRLADSLRRGGNIFQEMPSAVWVEYFKSSINEAIDILKSGSTAVNVPTAKE